ncbi:MAG: DUF885 domain-containing protein [Jatrophihabitans sp.]
MSRLRTRTAVDIVAENHLDEFLALNPAEATDVGVPDFDDRLPDYTPEWFETVSEHRRRTLGRLAEVEPADSNDRVTVAALRESLEVQECLRAAGVEESSLKNVGSPLQEIRDVFDLMPTDTVDHWAIVTRRLAAAPAAVDGYIESLRFAARRGQVAPRRQVHAGIEQCAENIGQDGFFGVLASDAQTKDGAPLPDSLDTKLEHGAWAASDAYERLRSFLADELIGQAGERDAVGRERYALHSREFLGARVDLEETYAWGQEELARITSDMEVTAGKIKPGASVPEAIAHLDADPNRRLQGPKALQEWMQRTSDAAVDALADTHFDIPQEIRWLECCIAPTQRGGIYYTGPSEDLVSRPGHMWWSVPHGVTEFSTWKEKSIVYHEGVPGHHLQVAQTKVRRNILNRWRRLASWVSGHGEGWALYAERLMADLGFLDDPGDYMGMLHGQSRRAARVVLDIGVHCEFEAPAEVGGGAWNYEKAWQFVTAHESSAEKSRSYALDRYLGWPGQAPSYKVGERLWLQLRAEAQAAESSDFSLTAFHRRVLDIGSVGLDVLRDAVLGHI